MRRLFTVIALAAIASPMSAQAPVPKHKGIGEMGRMKHPDPTTSANGTGVLPPGWKMRFDDNAGIKTGGETEPVRGIVRDALKRDRDIQFVTMGTGFHITSGRAAIYYNRKDMMVGYYTVKASFTQTKAPMHPEAYGLFVGGQHLQEATQSYLYFIVRGTGQYEINHRAAAEVHHIVEWTDAAALHKQDAAGQATNALEIKVSADSVHFLANGTQIKAIVRSEMHGFSTDGQVGLRVNHMLDVHVADFSVTGDKMDKKGM